MQSGTHMGYIHSFRDFAILNIAAIHAFVYAILIPHDFEPETMP